MYRILAVDDSPTVLASIRLALERHGYGLYTYQRAEEALKQLNSEKADLVITDLNMPGMDSITFIKQVRANAVYLGALRWIGVFQRYERHVRDALGGKKVVVIDVKTRAGPENF